MKSPDVVVVGAGLAGLAAAVELAARGARVTVVEAKAVLGGRATAFTDPQTGERVDNGQHALFGCYRETFAMLHRLGTADRVRVQGTLAVDFIDRSGRRSRLSLSPLPAPLGLVAGLLDWEALDWRDRIAALRLAGPLRTAREEQRAREGQRAQGRGQKPQRIAASPGETVEEWLINNGQTARLREMLWEPLALAALNQSVREAAAPPFASILGRMFSGDARDAALALPMCPLDELYAEPARLFIEARGGDVRIGSPARIHLDRGSLAYVETRGERMTPRCVVAAVAWHALPDLFSGDTTAIAPVLGAAAATAPSPIASVNLWLDSRVLSTPFLGLPGRAMQWVFDKQQLFDTATSHLTMVSSGAGALIELTNDELIALALRELREALPDARRAHVVRASAVRERRATFSLAPGQPPRPGTKTPIPGVVLAGDWIETGLPATIEGAVLSGRLAAEALS
jgi:hydroxysqualene dehydroxylase